MRTKLLFAFMLLSIPAFGQQNPIQIDANGLTQTLASGGLVTRGQIVKINSSGQVVPMATTDTSGAIGVAATSQQNQGQSVTVSIAGVPLVQVDGTTCVAGNVVLISSTTAGAGHCASIAAGQQIGIALSASSPGSLFWNVQLSPLAAGSATSIAALNGDGPLFNIKNSAYGAKGTARAVADAVSNSTTTITSATANFTAADNGSLVAVMAASGFPTVTDCPTGTVTFVNSTTITTSAACTVSGSGLNLYIGPDDSAAIAAACTALSNTKLGGMIYFPAGNYVLFGTSPACTFTNLNNNSTPPGINSGAGWYADFKGTVNIFVFPGYAYTTGVGDIIAGNGAPVPIFLQNININGLGTSNNLANQTLFYSAGFIVAKDDNIINFAMGSGANNHIFGWAGDGNGGNGGRSDFENVATNNIQENVINCIGFRFSVYNSDIAATDSGINISTGCGEGEIVGSFVSGNPAVIINTNTTVTEVGYMMIDSSQLCANSGASAVFAGATGTGTQTIYISNSNMNLGSAGAGGTGSCSGTTNVTGITTLVNNTVRVTNTRIETQGTGKTFNNAGTIVDAGANIYVSPTFSGTGPVILNPSSQGITPVLTGTGACATITTQVPSSAGTGLAGRFTCTGVTGASTITITWPVNAPNFYNCRFADQTTTANSITPTAGAATTCTASAATITANDVIQWSGGPI